MDALGLTDADVQGVWRDVQRSFGDLHPASDGIGYAASDKAGNTSPFLGQITIDPSWANKNCFTSWEYHSLFFTLFHEGMHSTDPWYVRANPLNKPDDSPYHQSVYNREAYEDFRMPNRPGMVKPRQPMWGKPRDTAVNVDKLYNDYLQRTCACRPGM